MPGPHSGHFRGAGRNPTKTRQIALGTAIWNDILMPQGITLTPQAIETERIIQLADLTLPAYPRRRQPAPLRTISRTTMIWLVIEIGELVRTWNRDRRALTPDRLGQLCTGLSFMLRQIGYPVESMSGYEVVWAQEVERHESGA